MRMMVLAATVVALSVLGSSPVASTRPATADFCSVSVDRPDVVTCSSSPGKLAAAERSEAAKAATQVLIARLYDNAGWDASGGYLNIYASSDCSPSPSGVDFQISDLGSWRNQVSSFRSYGNCATRLWSATGFAGTAYPSSTAYLTSTSYVGASFNDRAQSAQFS